MTDVTITHIGGPTALIEVGGWRILTDPTFDPPGKRYFFGWGTMSRKLVGPSILAEGARPDRRRTRQPPPSRRQPRPERRGAAADVGHDVHDQEGGQEARRQHRRSRRLGHDNPRGAGQADRSRSPRPRAATARSAAIRSPARSSASRSSGTARSDGELWVTGDTVLYDGLREVAKRLKVGTMLLHLGCRTVPLPLWLVPLHDGRQGRRRADRPRQADHRHPGALRGLVTLPAGPSRGRRQCSAPRRPPSPGSTPARRPPSTPRSTACRWISLHQRRHLRRRPCRVVRSLLWPSARASCPSCPCPCPSPLSSFLSSPSSGPPPSRRDGQHDGGARLARGTAGSTSVTVPTGLVGWLVVALRLEPELVEDLGGVFVRLADQVLRDRDESGGDAEVDHAALVGLRAGLGRLGHDLRRPCSQRR